MTAPNIRFSGGTQIHGGVTVKAAPSLMYITRNQIVDWIDPSVVTDYGFIQPDGYGEGVILLQLNQSQLDYIATLPGNPTSYILFEGNWGYGSTDGSPNTGFVLVPTGSWEYPILIPLGSGAFNNFSVYTGTWNFPASALTLIDWG